jgi:hypothetical protein
LLIDQVLPDTAEAYSAALAFLVDEQEATPALDVWRRLIAKDPHTDPKLCFKLTDILVDQERFGDAGTVWRQATANDPGSSAPYVANSLVYDGGFERDISGGGFGWRLSDTEGADFDFDADIKHSGTRSARLIFDGNKNILYEGLSQHILVSPATRYRFQGFLREENISTESGMRFEIVDPKDPQHVAIITPNETGTLPWTLEQVDFTTGPKTHQILVKLIRRPSERLDNKLRGSVWVDDVSLVPGGTGSESAKPGERLPGS